MKGKLPRFHVSRIGVGVEIVSLPEAVVRHAVHTLRMKPGEPLVLFDGSGTEYRARLARGEKKSYEARIECAFPGLSLSRPRIFLYQAPVRKERWEWLVEKATEIGVFAIVPLMTRFTEVDASEKFEKKKERWEAIAWGACEQSGRSIPPELRPPATFEKAMDALVEEGKGVLFFEGEAPPLKNVMNSLRAEDALRLFIGPEGGFSSEEVTLAASRGIAIASLGETILRAETAGIVASSLFLFER